MQFIPLGSRLLPDHPRLDLDSLHERADMPVPGLTHRYVDKALFLAARHVPGLLPLLHAQLRRRHRHGRGREVPAQGERRPLAAGVRVHPLAARARGHRHLGRRRLPAAARADHADRRDAAGDRPHPADALRDQGAGGDAAEDPDRRRLDRRAHRAWSSRAASCTRRWCSTPTSTTRARSPRSPRRRWTSCASAASPCATRPCCSGGVNDSVDTMTLLVPAARLRQRPPVLRLHARPGEGGRGPAHDAADRPADRAGHPRRDGRVQHADAGGRRAGRRRQARRALVRALRPHDRRLRVTPRRRSTPARSYFYFDPIDLLPPEGQARWADPAAARRSWSKKPAPPPSHRPIKGRAATSVSPAASASARAPAPAPAVPPARRSGPGRRRHLVQEALRLYHPIAVEVRAGQDRPGPAARPG